MRRQSDSAGNQIRRMSHYNTKKAIMCSYENRANSRFGYVDQGKNNNFRKEQKDVQQDVVVAK
jgi:hypothetical protein